MATNEAVKNQLIRARTALYIDHPMYGILSLRLMMKEDPSIPTACVDYKTISYNPDFIAGLDSNQTVGLIAHEVGHVMLQHIDRCAGRNPGKWNRACDYVLNDQLIEDGFTLPEGGLHNPAFKGMTADHVYTLLEDHPDDNNPGGSNAGAMDRMVPSPNQAAADEAAAEWEIAVIGAANVAKAQGQLPASMQRLVDELTKNKVRWQERLRRFATQHSQNDYSWTRPQRRLLPMGYYLPSLHSESMGALAIGIDTSGSIDQYTLNLFGAEVIAAKHAGRPQKLINIYCDAVVNHVDEYGEFDQVKFDMHGGGGTDFRPPFDYLAEKGVTPACFIYLTDGYGPFPDKPPPYPVLWVMTSNVVAPWGETIRIDT